MGAGSTREINMKILISWSGGPSHKVALALRDWLPVVLPFVKPWVSSEDIPKGARWAAELAVELKTTDYGIICVTPSNLGEPWINFEAGALAKVVDTSRVAPFLLGVDSGSLKGPLAQFQATTFDRDDVLRLLQSINEAAGWDKLAKEGLSKNFRTYWPDLEKNIRLWIKEAMRRVEEPVRAIPAPNDLSEQEMSILVTVANAGGEPVFPKMAAQTSGLHPEKLKHYMEKLEALGYISARHNYIYGTSYIVSREGRTFLVERGVL